VATGDYSNFRLELMDKKSNSSGLQIADLTARPIGNHYLHATGHRSQTDQRAIEVLIGKLRFCSGTTCGIGKYDVFHEGLKIKGEPMYGRLDHPITVLYIGQKCEIIKHSLRCRNSVVLIRSR